MALSIPVRQRKPQWRFEETHMEMVALADEVIAGVERIVRAAAAGSRMAVINEANRLGHRAEAARRELLALGESI